IFHELLPITFTFKDEPGGAQYLQQSLRETYRRLPHHPQITRVLEDSKRRIGVDDYVGLHVRRGDVPHILRRNLPKPDQGPLPDAQPASALKAYVGRTTLLESYHDAVEQSIAASRRIVFFSDSPEIFEYFTARYGARHFFNASRLVQPRQPI